MFCLILLNFPVCCKVYHIYKYPIISINYNLEETIKMKKNNNNNNDNVPNNYFNKLLNISKKNTF